MYTLSILLLGCNIISIFVKAIVKYSVVNFVMILLRQ